jgi:hypothetical protein
MHCQSNAVAAGRELSQTTCSRASSAKQSDMYAAHDGRFWEFGACYEAARYAARVAPTTYCDLSTPGLN